MTLKNTERIFRRILSVTFAALVLMSVGLTGTLVVSADTEGEKTQGYFKYIRSDDGVHITEYTGPGGDVYIPDTIDDGVIVGIEEEVFWYRDDITAVRLPQYLEIIGERAFQGCSALTSLVLPDTVYELRDACFDSCTALESINIPADLFYVGAFVFDSTPWIKRFDGNTSIIFGGRVFYKYFGDAETVVIPKGVLSISANAFEGNETLSYISIPDTVGCIGNFAFYNCPALKSVRIPESVFTMGEYTFGCYDDLEAKEIAVYDDFVVYSEEKDENGESFVAATFCKERGIELRSPALFATPDELPEAELCVVKNNEDGGKGKGLNINDNAWIMIVIVVVSCVGVIGGIYLVVTMLEKKNKTNAGKNKKQKK